MFKVGGPTKEKIMPKLFVSVKNSFQRYNADLEAKREYRERIEKEKSQRKAEIEENKQQVRIYLKSKMIQQIPRMILKVQK